MEGYEIHMGCTQTGGTPFCHQENGVAEGCYCSHIFGTYLHGLFDTGDLTVKLADWLCMRKGIAPQQAVAVSHAAYQQRQFDVLAEKVREALDMKAVYRLMEEYQ